MDRQSRSKMNTQIYEEASAWFVECRAGDLDDTGRREFDRWLRKSPEHLSSYLEIAAIWNEGPLLDPGGKWSVATLIEHALGADEDNVVPLSGVPLPTASRASAEDSPSVSAMASSPACTTKPWLTGWRRLAIAASIAVLTILAGTQGMLRLSSPIYATALGEQRSIQFEDGSTVELNSSSKIRVKYSKRGRGVDLIEGQALFHVAHDTSRPFIVAVGATRVRAVGTQFDVDKRASGTVVTVVEGRVAVYSAPRDFLSKISGDAPRLPPIEALPPSMRPDAAGRPARLSSATKIPAGSSPTGAAQPPDGGAAEQSSLLVSAGEQVTVTADAAQKTVSPNIAGATAWREREIVFEAATLSDVAEEFNRYNRRKLVIDDPKLYGFHISGIFSSTDPDSLIKFLRERPGVKVTETDSTIRIEKNRP